MLQRYEGVTSRDCSFLWLDSFEEEREKYSDRYPFKDGRTFAAGLLCHVNFTCPFGIARGGVGSWLTRAWYLYWLEIKFVFQNDLIVTKSQNELSSNIKRGLQCRWPLLRCRFCRGNIFHGEFITLFPLDSFFFSMYILYDLYDIVLVEITILRRDIEEEKNEFDSTYMRVSWLETLLLCIYFLYAFAISHLFDIVQSCDMMTIE